MTAHSLYIMTDTHYVSRRTAAPDSKSFARRERGDQIALRAGPQILRSFFDEVLADPDAEAVLITGDLINGGDKLSHEDFIGELSVLTEAGKRVYVTAATHDYCGMGQDENFFRACRYTQDGSEDTEPTLKADLRPLYRDFGPAQADSVDAESGSYSLQLFPGVRLIAIDDNGNGRSHCGLFDEGFRWLESEIKKANAAGECVLLAVHHPVLPPWDVFSHVVDFEMFGGYRRLWELMCETGVRLVFTGHTHVQSIRKYTDGAGRYFYDVATTALVSAPGCMRKVTVDPETRRCEIKSVRIDTIRDWDTGGKNFFDYVYRLNFVGAIEEALPLANTDWNAFLAAAEGLLPVDKLKAHPHLVKFGIKKALRLKLKTAAKFGKKYNGLTKDEIKAMGDTTLMSVFSVIMRHIYSGNAPFGPETREYKALKGATERAQKLAKRFKVSALDKVIPAGQTLWDVAEPFVCNNRTGDDDTLELEL